MAYDYAPHLDWIAAQQSGMRDELLRLSDINSGSFNTSGVNAVGDRMDAMFAPLLANRESLALKPYSETDDRGEMQQHAIGNALRLRKRPESPLKIFLAGHLDTVFGPGHPFQKAQQVDADTLRGPGVADLKGGLLVMLLALSALERSPWKERIGWEVLLNPDEELGSQGSAPLFCEAATRHHFGLVFEPSFPDGNLASTRKGSGNFEVVIRGRAAHAGRDHALGRNAIRAGADFIAALDRLNGIREGLTLNPGYVKGGGASNIVPDLCIFKFNVRTTSSDDEAWLLRELEGLAAETRQQEGFGIEIRGGFTRPPKIISPGIQRLSELIADCGHQLGLDLQFQATGGCCDGNNLAAAGLPNIDNLGVVGGEIHTDREFMRVSSLTERAQLTALLLMRLASGEWDWNA